MKRSYTNAQVRDAERKIQTAGTPVHVLMERAGEKLAEKTAAAMERLGIDDVLFVCGGGNNGGDGFVAARLLAEKGKEVSVLCPDEKFSADCSRAKYRYKGEVLGRIPRRRYALIVDCVLGTGLSRAPEGNAATLVRFINGSGAYVISADIPSGLSENGVALSPCVHADETLCMGLMKNALVLADGADTAGEVEVAQIGVSSMESGAEIWERADVKAFFPKKHSNVNKGMFGKAAIWAQGALSGAGYLAAGACLKSGAGYTFLSVREECAPFAACKYPACVVKTMDTEALLGCDSIALGMGAGVSEELYALIRELLSSFTGTLVLDADALNTLAAFGTDALKKKSCDVILTPHPKEFARLVGKNAKDVLENPVLSAQEFARKYGVILVLKNNRSVISDGRRTAINTTGSPALAKGGSGDLLSGFLAGTCARGIPPYEAACVAAYAAGLAGEIAAEEMGEYAPDATDVIAYLPAALKRIAE